MQLAMGNEEGDEKFLDINDYRDIGSLDDANAEITEMDAENGSGQIIETIDDKAGFQDTLHTEGLKTEEPIAEVLNQLEDSEMGLDQEVMATESNTCSEETNFSGIEDEYVQIPGATKTVKISECEKNSLNIVKRDSSGSVEGKSRFQCHCGKSFSQKHNLQTHKKTHDTNFESSLCCPNCGKKFSTKQILTRHLKSVHQGYFYECPICGNRQTQAGKSIRHIKKQHPESGVKPIEKCDKTLSFSSQNFVPFCITQCGIMKPCNKRLI
jgi:uncharacterized Zn-finger protein